MPFVRYAIYAALTAVLLATAACTRPALRTDPGAEPSNRQETTQEVDGEALRAFERLDLARRLVLYARVDGGPQALVVAARLLAETPVDVADGWVRRTEGNGAPPPPGAALTLDPDVLLAEARAAARGDDVLLAWIDDEARRIAEGTRGPLVALAQTGYVRPGAVDYYEVVFEEGRPAVVDVGGTPGEVLVVSVYDEDARLIATDDFAADGFRLVWTPVWRGPFTIHVRNAGRRPASYTVAVN